jgi:hypothetical protein
MDTKLQTAEQTTKRQMTLAALHFEDELQVLAKEGLGFTIIERRGDFVLIELHMVLGDELTRYASAMRLYGYKLAQKQARQNLHSLKLSA